MGHRHETVASGKIFHLPLLEEVGAVQGAGPNEGPDLRARGRIRQSVPGVVRAGGTWRRGSCGAVAPREAEHNPTIEQPVGLHGAPWMSDGVEAAVIMDAVRVPVTDEVRPHPRPFLIVVRKNEIA